MKKALIVAAAIALIVWVISWFRAPQAMATSAAREWPAGLGTLDSVASRYPPMHANDAARKLTALAKALPKNEVVQNFVTREIVHDSIDIGQPPTLPDVSAMRDLLLREPVVWDRTAGVNDFGDDATTERRVVQMAIARALVAGALKEASWEDLHAVWNLVRSMDAQPQMMSQTASLAMVRMINAVAWKMPLPPPEWFAELQRRDDLRHLLEAYQHQAAAHLQKPIFQLFPIKPFADAIENDRRVAEFVFHETRCDVTSPMNDAGTDLSSVWRRAFRYRAEQEATANAIRVRKGKPIETRSRCSDGSWSFDGTTLRFSRAIATAAPDRPMPLVLHPDG